MTVCLAVSSGHVRFSYASPNVAAALKMLQSQSQRVHILCIWFRLWNQKWVRQSCGRRTRRRSGNLRRGIDLWGLYQSFPVSPAIDPLSVGFNLDRWTSNKRYINQIPQPVLSARNTSRSTVKGQKRYYKNRNLSILHDHFCFLDCFYSRFRTRGP